MKIRSSKKKIMYGVFAGFALAVAICAVIGYFGYKHMHNKQLSLIDKYEVMLEEYEIAASSNEVAYTLRNDVLKGELITESMLQKVFIPKGAKSEDTLLLPDLTTKGEPNMYAKTDILANTITTKSLFYAGENITNDIREGEYSYIEIPTNVNKDSYVDVRIQFPTGDEFVVLTKKKVKDLNGITIHMNVGEGELLTLSSALVDAYIEGAKIYAIPYVDEHMQEESITTYPVKSNVKALIQESPNVINIAKHYFERQNRERLDMNLQELSSENRSKVESGTNVIDSKVSEDTARRDQEERLNRANEEAAEQQSLLVGGDE